MKRLLRSPLAGGILILLLVNLGALAALQLNRSDPPDSQLRLTERELSPARAYMPWRLASQSSLQLQWRLPRSSAQDHHSSQLSHQHLQQLGIQPQPAGKRRCCHPRTREVLLVLEMDGDSWRSDLQLAQSRLDEATARLRQQPDERSLQAAVEQARIARQGIEQGSRLYVAAFGLDAARLRAQYPDRARYAITPARVESWQDRDGSLHGYLSGLQVPEVHVPSHWLPALRNLPGGVRHVQEPRMQARVAWGRQLRPWLLDLQATSRPATDGKAGQAPASPLP